MKKKCKLNLTIIFFFVFFFHFTSISQNSGETSPQSFNSLTQELSGKYQIQMIGIRNYPVIPQELLMEIKEKQKQSERVYFFYKENIKIMILSKDEALDGRFISNDEFILYFN